MKPTSNMAGFYFQGAQTIILYRCGISSEAIARPSSFRPIAAPFRCRLTFQTGLCSPPEDVNGPPGSHNHGHYLKEFIEIVDEILRALRDKPVRHGSPHADLRDSAR